MRAVNWSGSRANGKRSVSVVVVDVVVVDDVERLEREREREKQDTRRRLEIGAERERNGRSHRDKKSFSTAFEPMHRSYGRVCVL